MRNEALSQTSMWSTYPRLVLIRTYYWSTVLMITNRDSIGDVFENVKKFEKEVTDAKTAYLASDADTDRILLNKSKPEYIKWLKIEDSILRQKARIKWAEEGDSNTKYFHSTIKARRRRAQIYKIKDQHGQWVEGNANISKASIDHFSNILTENPRDLNLDFIRGCNNLISAEDNYHLIKTPITEGIKMDIDSMDPNSCARLDGFNGLFFSTILGYHQKRGSIFCAFLLSWINNILPKIISENQSSFVKGRQITENILLTQEIIHGIRPDPDSCNASLN
ncbi:uncharacterized protein LOC132639280 [Lycium barbarum]|uniref:uncharacterized protein LOC132639280 n=1 Tax=Lycium barbarum TaxID=112863 RepID=UPI00293E5177|nr:uncharacterized protein LOC132639280 [Lycium barbarum]